MSKPAFTCIGFTPREQGLTVNCGNCRMWVNSKCLDRRLLDKLYEESPKFKAYDHMVRGNKGVKMDA